MGHLIEASTVKSKVTFSLYVHYYKNNCYTNNCHTNGHGTVTYSVIVRNRLTDTKFINLKLI